MKTAIIDKPSSYSFANWRISTGEKELKFSVNEVIDAYENGLYTGMAITKEIRDKIKKNIEIVRKKGEEFFREINQESEKCHSIFLKTSWYDSYDLIYVLDSSDYQNDTISKKIYEKSWEYKDILRRTGIYVNISFIPENEHINFNRLKTDGYYCYYGKL